MASRAKIRKAAAQPSRFELFQNYNRDNERRVEIEAQYAGINHARTAYLLSNVNRPDVTPQEKSYFREHYDALEAVEARYRAELTLARSVEGASWNAWFEAED